MKSCDSEGDELLNERTMNGRTKNNSRNNMIWNIILYVFITIVFTGLLAVFQQKINLNFEKIVFPQLGPTIGVIIMIMAFSDLRFSINIDINKLIVAKSLLALGIPFLLFVTPFFIGKQVGL